MKISARIAVIMAAIFSIVCFGVAIKGFSSLGEMTDPTQISDAKGFAGFWAFLGAIGVVSGALSWWIMRTEKGDGDG